MIRPTRAASPGVARRWRRTLVPACLCLITLYGALLRMDAFVSGYGAPDHPRWLAWVSRAAPIARYVEPAAYRWPPIAHPYVGGDPLNYLRFARGMKSFYQAHVREPVFLALTRGWLAVVGNQDIGLSLASMTGSIAWIAATGLLGFAVCGRGGGLLAALLLAIDYDAITWAPDGWRDDTFAALATLTAWAIVRLRQDPRVWRAVLAGAIAGLCMLTRITAFLFIVPGLAWIAADTGRPRARTAGMAALAAALAAVVLAPYLIACARATGDPLYAIDYHTVYYRSAEHLPVDAPQSAASYVLNKIRRRPIVAADTMLNGLFVHPFFDKWQGYNVWVPGLTTALMWISALGLLLLTGWADGRAVLVLALTSLAPYALTWNIAGGGEWRFTMHVYSVLLIACGALVTAAWRGRRVQWKIVGASAVVLLAGVGVYEQLPWWVQRDALANGEEAMLEAGPRDATFFGSGWSAPHADGNVTARVTLGARGTIDVPVPAASSYVLTLRCDPVAPGQVHEVAVLWNGLLLARFQLAFDPARVGTYRVTVPASFTHAGTNHLVLIPDATVPRTALGAEYAWLRDAAAAGLRVWYVRLAVATPER